MATTAPELALGWHRRGERGIDVIVVRPDDDLAAPAADAVACGTDALGVVGGDGSLAVVGAAAVAHGLPSSAFRRHPATPSRSTSVLTATIWSARSTRSPTRSSNRSTWRM
jgi:hypothetical protein